APLPPSSFPAQMEGESTLRETSVAPSPQWQEVQQQNMPPRANNSGPLPQFDPGESRWLQLEVGQVDSAISTQSTEATLNINSEDLLSPPPPVLSTQPQGPGGATENTNLPRPLEASERTRLRNLFSDMLPPDPLRPEGPAPVASNGADTPPVGGGETQTPISFAPLPPDNNQTLEANPAMGGATQPPPLEPESTLAISKAGSLLSVQTHFGAAEILPPLPPAPPLAGAETKGAVVPTPEKPRVAPSAPSRPPKAQGGGNATSPPVPTPRFSLSIINETGNEQITETYRAVLQRMGYIVTSSTTSGPLPGGVLGQTIISYPAGGRPRAQSLAQHLPGRKILEQSPNLPEITVSLR
ncbi:MAG: LytR C-terminal domain-containing protein, partial [Candidatus Adiutrix sp.]